MLNTLFKRKDAWETMQNLNPHALCAFENGLFVAVEDVEDEPGGKLYRLEYRATRDGHHAIAHVRYNPWAGPGQPANAGKGAIAVHCDNTGLICLGNGFTAHVHVSPFTLETAVRRARYWTVAFSFYMTRGIWVDP